MMIGTKKNDDVYDYDNEKVNPALFSSLFSIKKP